MRNGKRNEQNCMFKIPGKQRQSLEINVIMVLNVYFNERLIMISSQLM